MKDLNDQLIDLKSKLKERERLQVLREEVNKERSALEDKRVALRQQLEKEELDVEKLEGLSVKSIFHTVWGNKAERLEKEKQEVVAAKHKYDSILVELSHLEKESKYLQKKLEQFKDLDQQYEWLMIRKEERLRDLSEEFVEKLDQITEDKTAIINQRKELGEAIEVGNKLLGSLERVKQHLESAGNWGTMDLLGGGLLSTMAKHSKIDDAKSEISGSQTLLNKFHRELQDVGQIIQMENLEIGEFLTFADYFFDGLFADWSVQSKIRDAQNKVATTLSAIQKIISTLTTQLEETIAQEAELEQTRIELIEKS